MLGFSSFSQATFSSTGAAALAALGYLATTSAQLAAGTVISNGQAGPILPAATATFTANAFGDVDAQATVNVLNAIASFNIATLVDIQAKANITTPTVTATFTADQFSDVDAKANTSIGGSATATLTAADVEGDGQASGFLSTTAAFLSIYITDFADEDAQARAFMPVAASSITASAFGDVDAKANTDIGGSVTAELAVSAFDNVKGAANNTPSAVTATIANAAFDDVDAQATVVPPSALLTQAVNLDDPIAVRFDFGQFADSYDRSRVLYIVSYGGSDTVYVKEENRTVYIDKDMQNYTVYITG